MNKEQQKHLGQRQLDGITEYDEQTKDRPRGMPPFSAIKAETAKLGLPDSDAEHIDLVWLMSGFKTGKGNRIVSWKAAIFLWYRQGYFPSQKKMNGEMTNEILDALAANPSYKKVDVQAEGWKFKKWCTEGGHRPLVTSFVKFLNAKL